MQQAELPSVLCCLVLVNMKLSFPKNLDTKSLVRALLQRTSPSGVGSFLEEALASLHPVTGSKPISLNQVGRGG